MADRIDSGEAAMVEKVRCDQYRWLISKLLPSVYGDRPGSAGAAEQGAVFDAIDLPDMSDGQLDAPEHLAQIRLAEVAAKGEGQVIEGHATDAEEDSEAG